MKTKRTFLTVALSGMIAFLSTSGTFASETLPVTVDDWNMENMIDLNSADIEDFRIVPASSDIQFKPFITKKDNYLMVNFLNADQKDIKFFIENNNSIYYSGYEGKDLSFGKVFDISRMPMDTYAAKMTVGSKTFYHYFVTD